MCDKNTTSLDSILASMKAAVCARLQQVWVSEKTEDTEQEREVLVCVHACNTCGFVCIHVRVCLTSICVGKL